jgi:MFS family permease
VRRGSYFLLLAAYVLLSCQQISFRKSPDLGRLLRDGELILAGQTAVLHQNFYSYTNPAAEFPNHHWLAAVLAYGASKLIGLEGLNLVYIALGAAAFFLYFRIAEREAGLPAATAFAAALMPLMIVRVGIRPEVFSMLLAAVFFTILWGIYGRIMAGSWLWMLPALELFWVNVHPGFALGPVLIGTFLATELVTFRKTGKVAGAWKISALAAVLGLTIVAGVANPNGIRGLLFPLTVSSNYGMDVQENISMFKLQDNTITQLMEVSVLVLAGFWIAAYRRRIKMQWPLLLLSTAFAAGTLMFYRIYVFTGGFILVAICANLAAFRVLKPKKAKSEKKPSLAWLGWIWAAAGFSLVAFTSTRWNNAGLGLEKGDQELAQFLKTNRIAGTVFNSYASGGYLIHYLPEQKVYIDSRPEAYPASFVRDYMLALKDEDAWRRIVSVYNFDFICFVQMNQEEGQFVVRRIQDPEWAAVLAGSEVVLVRRKPQFEDVISSHPLRF